MWYKGGHDKFKDCERMGINNCKYKFAFDSV